MSLDIIFEFVVTCYIVKQLLHDTIEAAHTIHINFQIDLAMVH